MHRIVVGIIISVRGDLELSNVRVSQPVLEGVEKQHELTRLYVMTMRYIEAGPALSFSYLVWD